MGFIKESGEIRSGQTVWVVADDHERQCLIAWRQNGKGKNFEVAAITQVEDQLIVTLRMVGIGKRPAVGQRVKIA